MKQTKPDALIIGELWQKDTTLLRFLRGDRADSTMNYRLRDAVLALLATDNFDSKGFADSGHQIKPSEFAARLQSMREDYSDATYYSLMNLLGSHDTARLLWILTPGANNRNDKEFNATNLAEGKKRVQLASLIQFALPGAPTIYYGDEVGLPVLTIPMIAVPTRGTIKVACRTTTCASTIKPLRLQENSFRHYVPAISACWSPTTMPKPSPSAARPARRRRCYC